MPESNTTGEEAAELRRALVRFLVEASLEDTSQAKLANDLLQAVRAVPAEQAGQLAGLERRIDKLAAQLEQLSGAVKGAGAQGPSAPPVRSLVPGIAAGVITGIAASLLTATLLSGSLSGLRVAVPSPAAMVANAAPAPLPGRTALPLNSLAPAAAPVSAAPRDAAPAVAAWDGIWSRMLEAPVSSCAAGGGVALRKCVCPASTDEECTLAQAQSVPGGLVMVAQALIKVRAQSREEIDGRLGPSTVRALVKLTRGCGSLGKLTQQMAQDSRRPASFDPDRALEPILTGLSQEPQCVEEP